MTLVVSDTLPPKSQPAGGGSCPHSPGSPQTAAEPPNSVPRPAAKRTDRASCCRLLPEFRFDTVYRQGTTARLQSTADSESIEPSRMLGFSRAMWCLGNSGKKATAVKPRVSPTPGRLLLRHARGLVWRHGGGRIFRVRGHGGRRVGRLIGHRDDRFDRNRHDAAALHIERVR